MGLSLTTVSEYFTECLYRRGESTGNPVEVKGLDGKVVRFSSTCLQERARHIRGLLDQLSATFRRPQGDTFDNLCLNQSRQVWTHNRATVEQLLALGLAVEGLEYVRVSNGQSNTVNIRLVRD